jgi:hypothetical protein
MKFALPSGVVNTDSAYYYPDDTMTLGPLVKEPNDQTLIIIDYSQLTPSHIVGGYDFLLDVTSNPALVVSYPQVNAEQDILTFLVSGGIVGQQYNLTVRTTIDINQRLDVLTINIPSSADCCERINPVPTIYSQLPLGDPTQGYVNTGVRYFWGSAPPNAPNVMDQWYSPDTGVLSEWVTDGTQYRWQVLMNEGLVEEAPADDILYGRYNGYWVRTPIQSDALADGRLWARQNNLWVPVPDIMDDAPSTNFFFGRFNGGWEEIPIQSDAPNDGNAYIRQRNAWVGQYPFFPDAPQDGVLYSRIDSNWMATPIQEDAPNNGEYFVRNNRQWIAVLFNSFITDAPTDGTLYGRQDAGWAEAYPASNPANYVPLSVLTATLLAFMPLRGGTFTGAISTPGLILPNGPATLSISGGQPGQILVAANTQSTLAWGPSPIPEPPSDGVAYARQNGVWVPTASGAGVADAPTDGTTYSRNDAAWVHLIHSDITDWDTTLTALLTPYALITMVPLGSTSFPIMDGAGAIGTSLRWARADHVHDTDTSRYAASNPAGYQTAAQMAAALAPYAPITSVPVASNAAPQMNGTAAPGGSVAFSRADHVHPSDTSLYPASNPAGYQTAAQVGAAISTAVTNANIDCGTY